MAQTLASTVTQLGTVVPRLDKLPMSSNPFEKHAVDLQRRKALDSLVVLGSFINDPGITTQVQTVTSLTKAIGGMIHTAEESFVGAVRQVEKTTNTLLIKIRSLNLMLSEGQICQVTKTIYEIIQMISDLLTVLENSKIPVKFLHVDVERLVSALQILSTTLRATQVNVHAQQVNNQGILNSIWKSSETVQLTATGGHLANMENLTNLLSEIVDPAEIQIQLAINHLTDIQNQLNNTYDGLLETIVQLQLGTRTKTPLGEGAPECGDEKMHLYGEEKILVQEGIRNALEQIENIRLGNDDIVKKISVLGFAAIGHK